MVLGMNSGNLHKVSDVWGSAGITGQGRQWGWEEGWKDQETCYSRHAAYKWVGHLHAPGARPCLPVHSLYATRLTGYQPPHASQPSTPHPQPHRMRAARILTPPVALFNAPSPLPARHLVGRTGFFGLISTRAFLGTLIYRTAWRDIFGAESVVTTPHMPAPRRPLYDVPGIDARRLHAALLLRCNAYCRRIVRLAGVFSAKNMLIRPRQLCYRAVDLPSGTTWRDERS